MNRNNIFKVVSQDKRFQNSVVAVILLSAVLVGLETYRGLYTRYYSIFHALDLTVQLIFTVEIIIRILAFGKKPLDFFKSANNNFDFVITALFYLPFGGAYASVFRLVRIFRVLRLITALPKLQLIVGALLKSVPSMGYIGILLLIQFYIFAVLGNFLFGVNDPAHFGDLGASMLTLFQIITLEGWVDIMRAQEAVFLAPLYFISFILLGTMIVLNLFIGVIMSGFEEVHRDLDKEALRKNPKSTKNDRLKHISMQLEALKTKLDLLIEDKRK